LGATDLICHEGVIDRIEDGKAFVRIIAQSACESCHSKGICSILENKEKLIEVKLCSFNVFKPGEKVNLLMNRSLGNNAVLLGYFLPFLLLLITLLISSQFFVEGFAGLISILAVGLYYIIIALLKNKIGRSFTFTIQSLS
jgi:positive regulator of sigma E activity